MAELLRHYLYYAFHSMTKYDYMAIGWVIFLAFLLMFLGAFVRKRALSYFMLLLGIVLLFFGPPAIKITFDGYIRATDVNVTGIKALRFSPALVVEGNLTNKGKIDYSACDLVVSVYRPDRILKEATAWLKPRRVAIQTLTDPLPRGETKAFKILVDPFTVRGDFNVSVTARCYP